MLETVGAIVVALFASALIVAICAVLWGYAQAAGGYIRARRIAARYDVKLWKEPRPRFFALKMVHWQAWHCSSNDRD